MFLLLMLLCMSDPTPYLGGFYWLWFFLALSGIADGDLFFICWILWLIGGAHP